MKISKRHRELVKKEFTDWMSRFIDLAIDYRGTLLQVMENHNTKLKLDDDFFKELAKEALIREMEKFTASENGVDSVKKFLEQLDQNDEDDDLETV